MLKRILSLVVAGLFLFNSVAFGLAPEDRLAPPQRAELLDIMKLHAQIKYEVSESARESLDLLTQHRDRVVTIDGINKGSPMTGKGDEITYNLRKKRSFDDGNLIFIPCSIKGIQLGGNKTSTRTYLLCAHRTGAFSYEFKFFTKKDLEGKTLDSLLRRQDDAFLRKLAGVSMPAHVKNGIGRFVEQQNGPDRYISDVINNKVEGKLALRLYETDGRVKKAQKFIEDFIQNRDLLVNDLNNLIQSGQVMIIDGLDKPHAGGIGIYLPENPEVNVLIHEIFAKCGLTHDECNNVESIYSKYNLRANRDKEPSQFLTADELRVLEKAKTARFASRMDDPLNVDYYMAPDNAARAIAVKLDRIQTFLQNKGIVFGLISLETLNHDMALEIAQEMIDAQKQGALYVPEIALRGTEENIREAIEFIKELRAANPGVIIAAGSVSDTEGMRRALVAGVDIIITPGLVLGEKDIEEIRYYGCEACLGIASQREAELAKAMGLKFAKAFPLRLKAKPEDSIETIRGALLDAFSAPLASELRDYLKFVKISKAEGEEEATYANIVKFVKTKPTQEKVFKLVPWGMELIEIIQGVFPDTAVTATGGATDDDIAVLRKEKNINMAKSVKTLPEAQKIAVMLLNERRLLTLGESLNRQINEINKSDLYSAEVIHQQGHLLVRFTDQKEEGTHFTVMVDQGFRVISWSVAGKERLRVPEVLDKDLGSGIFSMYPWVNRIEDGKITRNGREMDIRSIPGLSMDGDTGNPLHGVARVSEHWKNFVVGMNKQDGGIFIQAAFETTDYPGLAEVLGHSKLVKVYSLTGHSLKTDVEVENLTTEAEAERDGGYEVIADIGEHPFVAYTPGKTTLQAEVTGVFPVDRQLIPTGAPVSLPEEKDFRTPKPVTAALDNTVTVTADSEGVVTVKWADKENGMTTFRMRGMFSAEPGEEALVHLWGGNTTNYLGTGAVEAVAVAANGPNRQGQVGGSRPLGRVEFREGSVTMTVDAENTIMIPDQTTIDVAVGEITAYTSQHDVVVIVPQDFDNPTECRRLMKEFNVTNVVPYNRNNLENLPELLGRYSDKKVVLISIGLDGENIRSLVEDNKEAFRNVVPANAAPSALEDDADKLYRKSVLAVGLLGAVLSDMSAEEYADSRVYRVLSPLLRMMLPENMTADDYIKALVSKDIDPAVRFLAIIKGILRPIERANIESLRFIVDTLIAA